MDYSPQYVPPYQVEQKARRHIQQLRAKERQQTERERIMLKAGIKGHQELTVTQELTAGRMGSGSLAVFATPAMLALMEKTAYTSVEEYLEPGWGSVGTSVELQHVAASPVGMKIVCDSELVRVEGRKLVFSVEAYDQQGLIGKAVHERFLVENETFQEKADRKLSCE